MNKLSTLIILFMFTISAWGQESKFPSLDSSPMDQVYFPQETAWRNYLSEDQRNITPKIRVMYSRPQMNGRTIFGELIPYGKEWRLGANEATTITFYQAVGIGGETIPAGVYTLFAEVNPNSWTYHFSTESGIWGSANRDMSKTIASVKVPSTEAKNSQEALSITFVEVDEKTVHMITQWDKTRTALPISFNPVVFNNLDQSPMDIAHYPSNSAYTNYLDGEEKNVTPKIQVVYSRPFKKERNIFGGLLNMDQVWRVGANEATEIVFYEDIMIGDTEVKRGRYSMFAEIHDGEWEIIFSKDYPIWGAANRDLSKDVARAMANVSTETEVVENLSIIFEEKGDKNVHMIIAWDTTRASLPITFK